MKISWHCLNNIIELKNINIKKITHKLTLAGLEVENTTYNHLTTDTFIQINITANRQDLNGFIFIANEIAALFNLPINLPKISANTQLPSLTFNYKYIIKNLNIKTSQTEKKLYFSHLEIKRTDTILDTINFINLKWGQNIQAYHVRKTINGDNKNNSIEKKFQENLLNKEFLHKININNIYNLNDAINIAFINLHNTNTYSAYAYQELFNLLNIEETERIPYHIPLAHKQFKQKISKIICNLQIIKNILGPSLDFLNSTTYQTSNIINILTKLNFQVQKTLQKIIISIPAERLNDINHEIDIVEEIGRIYGFKNFRDKIPLFEKRLPHIHKDVSCTKIRKILRSSGLHEVINYSLIKQSEKIDLTIINPLNQELTTLRKNLLENLLKSKKYNIDQKNKSFEIFEIGTIFTKRLLNPEIIESKHLGCLLGDNSFNRLNWRNKSSEITWHQAKGQIEEFLEKIQAKIIWSTEMNSNNFIEEHHLTQYIHANRSVYLNNQNKTIGIFSQLSNRMAHKLDINQTLFFLELNILDLLQAIEIKKHLKFRYSTYPHYPQITRDLSIRFKNQISMKVITEKIDRIKHEDKFMIESVKVINEYYNNKDIKTLCLRIIYRSSEKTLTNQEVQRLDDIFKEKLSLAIKSKA
uniref:phenylalanine--tRNA ligase n=1 Tax=Porolithon onkodes TaxID=231751 RepID=A0A2Z2KXH6_9FLOR|nr:phenylalanine tRNA synthetase [Porolithon onkodes]ASB29665.1 phenylalanine tRNA synthetase [Porolithon onkodes]